MTVDRLHAKAAEWKVVLGEIQETFTSLLGFGVRDGRKVVLKITKRAGDESQSGEMLKAFNGDGTVIVYEYEPGAVLLERLEPGEPLVNVVKRGADDEATRILAQVIRKLANHMPPTGCPCVADWGRGFDRYLQSGDKQVAEELVRDAQRHYRELALSQTNLMLLHGDLQHYNVLFDNQRGWIAIDPKGVVGELEYEVGALLRNPVELPQLFCKPHVVTRRLELLVSSLDLNYSRALRWCFAQAVLSAIWDVEDGFKVEPNHPVLRLAHTLENDVTRE